MARNGHREHTITDDFRPAEYRPPADGWREVRIPDVARPSAPRGTFCDLLTELVLRLENTPADRALLKAFPTEHDAKRVTKSLRGAITRRNLPTDALIISKRGADLYVRRGPSFKQLEIADGKVQRWTLPEED